jgi:hypothetical protein
MKFLVLNKSQNYENFPKGKNKNNALPPVQVPAREPKLITI